MGRSIHRRRQRLRLLLGSLLNVAENSSHLAFQGSEVELNHAAPRMKYHIDGRPHQGKMPAYRFAHAPSEPVPVDSLAHGFGDKQSDAGRDGIWCAITSRTGIPIQRTAQQ